MKNLLKKLLLSFCVLAMLVTPTSVFANEAYTHTQNRNILNNTQTTSIYKMTISYKLGISTVTVLSSRNGKDFSPVSQIGGVFEKENGDYYFYEFSQGSYNKLGNVGNDIFIVFGDLNELEEKIYNGDIIITNNTFIDTIKKAGYTVVENFIIER